MNKSKILAHSDESGFLFAQEMLNGDITAAVNFDRIQKHPVKGYIIFEYLLCDEKQKVSPHSSHPRKYWNKNSKKFLSLWEIAKALKANLYLVNYAKKNTQHSDEILIIKVIKMSAAEIEEELIEICKQIEKDYESEFDVALKDDPCKFCGYKFYCPKWEEK